VLKSTLRGNDMVSQNSECTKTLDEFLEGFLSPKSFTRSPLSSVREGSIIKISTDDESSLHILLSRNDWAQSLWVGTFHPNSTLADGREHRSILL